MLFTIISRVTLHILYGIGCIVQVFGDSVIKYIDNIDINLFNSNKLRLCSEFRRQTKKFGHHDISGQVCVFERKKL